MDFKTYYFNQARNENAPVFRGTNYQKGYGFGDVFKKFFSWIMPIVKKNATPVIKTLGKHVIKTASHIANDAINGESFSKSAKERINNTLDEIKLHYGNGKHRLQSKKNLSKQYLNNNKHMKNHSKIKNKKKKKH
jgi:hypothetical protein